MSLEALYQVVFHGNLNFSDPETIQLQLAQDYQKPKQAFEDWFQGQRIVLKSNVELIEAQKIALYFEKLGMVIEIQSLTQANNTIHLNKTTSLIASSQALSKTSKPAGFWIRCLAGLIDAIVLCFLAVITNYALALVNLDIGSELASRYPELASQLNNVQAISEESQWLLLSKYMEQLSNSVFFYIFVLIQILYFALSHASTMQATLGKRALGIIVVNKHGQSLSLTTAFLRALFLNFPIQILSVIANVSCLMIGLTRNKQGLHDKILGTYVIYGKADLKHLSKSTDSQPKIKF